MQLALLGIDDTILAIAEAAQRSGQAQIVMIDALAKRASDAAKLAPHAKVTAQWEDVLVGNDIDAVLVAADDSTLRIEQLRRLVQLQLPTLVSHPISLSMLDAYEIDMIHRESPGVLIPWIPARWHPAVAELWDIIEAGERASIGHVEQVLFERFMSGRDREAVLRQFAQDADLLQYLAGDATKIHALGSAIGEATTGAYSNLNVQMTCGDGLVCRWTVAPIEEQTAGRLTIVGLHGKAILQIPDYHNKAWQLEIRARGNVDQRQFSHWDPATMAIDRLAAGIASEPVEPTWTEAARTIELADSIDRSLARGRTIDLHQEEHSDINTFKGTMASVGCGLLMLGLLLIVMVAIAHSIAVNAGWINLAAALSKWPYLLLGVLGIFLLLQLFLLVGTSRNLPRPSAKQTNPDRQ